MLFWASHLGTTQATMERAGRRGRRQRRRADLAEAGGDDASADQSVLAKWLVQQWAWGKLSPQQVQMIANLANADVHTALSTKRPLVELQRLSNIGGAQQKAGNMHRDLLARLGPNTFQLQEHSIPLIGHGFTEQMLLLPHVVFATTYHKYPAYFFEKILDKHLQQQFWEEMGATTPCLHGREVDKAIPISLHGDAVPCVGVGKSWSKSLDIISWTSMVGKGSTLQKNFIIWVVFVHVQSQRLGLRTSLFFSLLSLYVSHSIPLVPL